MSETLQAYYFLIVFLGMLYTFHKVGISRISVLIVLIFWQGFFQYLSDITASSNIHNIYKIVVVVYAFKLSWSKIFSYTNKNDQKINVVFILFSVSFWLSYFLYGGEILTMLSQYLFKYGLIFVLYHYFKDIIGNTRKRELLKHTLLVILYVQIALSIVKLSFFGFGVEPIVGSMSAGGAGTAVVIPIVALIFYWLIKNGKFTRSDWIVSVLIFTIAIASGKRQPIVFFPIVLFSLFVFVQKYIRASSLVKYLPIALMIFYMGVRLTPSVTPEKKAWGSFSISYISDYAFKYYFGTPEPIDIFSQNYDAYGRGGGIAYYFQPHKLNLISIREKLFGKGRYEVATKMHGRFTATGRSNYEIRHRGLMGEAGAMLYSFGYVGTIFMLLLAISIIKTIKDNRLALVILLYYLWDFMFYYNQVIYSNQSAIIILFIIFYSNTVKYKNKSVMLSRYYG
jgi:hypothetical protein